MSWEDPTAFFTLHRDLPREGPGEAADVHWALDTLGHDGPERVLDAACGPGADLAVLAQALPEAQITGIEKVAHFVDAARARVADWAPRVTVRQGDMRDPEGPFDLIWCTGALYFLGVSEGLRGWRDALAPGGAVVFSEPVLLDTPPDADVAAFWEDYPQITDLDGIVARVNAAGFAVQAHRMLIGAPWEAYYAPMQARIDALRSQSPDATLCITLDSHQLEIDRWRAAADRIAYAQLIVTPQ